MLTEITDDTFRAEVLDADGPVLVDFWAEWCGPCRAVAPSLEALARSYDGRLKIKKLNVDDSPLTPTSYGVRSIPTLLLFDRGQIVATKVGAAPKAALDSWLSDSLGQGN
ncbi:MAG: thioredoxin [Geminicoccaceae bacterium]